MVTLSHTLASASEILEEESGVRAVCGLLADVSFSVLDPVAASQDPGYTFLGDSLGDLGICPGKWAFNSALMPMKAAGAPAYECPPRTYFVPCALESF